MVIEIEYLDKSLFGSKGDVQRWMGKVASEPAVLECITWPFATDWDGRADAWCPQTKRMKPAYRLIWQLRNNAVFPSGAQARHTCGNGHRGCVNPVHILSGTNQDNVNDRELHGRTARGSASGQAVLTEPNVIDICQRLEAGETQTNLAREYRPSRSAIKHIWNGRTWRHVNGPRKSDALMNTQHGNRKETQDAIQQ